MRLAVLFILCVGCVGPRPFACRQDAECVLDGVAGRCEGTGFCSFPDEACPLGTRYGTHASDELSDACVPACIAEIALGEWHGCARTEAREVWCWGQDVGEVQPPTKIVGLSDVRAIAAGGHHSCAVVGEEQALECWGDNSKGQTDAMGLSGVTAVGLGAEHSCAAVANGTVSCWGSDSSGQLGFSPPMSLSLPEAVRGVSAGGNSTCASGMGSIWCWGDNACGKLALIEAEYPLPTETLAGITSTPVLGDAHGCAAVGTDVKCWGNMHDSCTDVRGTEPLEGEQRPPPKQLAAGRAHNCVLYDTEEIACWGDAQAGQLGPGFVSGNSELKAINVPLLPVRQVVAGGDTSCALTTTGRLFCWGAGTRGQLGSGTVQSAHPIEMTHAVVCP